MIVEIFLVVDPDAPPDEHVRGRCPLLKLGADGYDEESVGKFLKRTALIAIGQNYKKIPDIIEFRVSSKEKK